MSWRDKLPAVDAEFAGRVARDLSRQEARALKRKIAKVGAATDKAAARKATKRRGAKATYVAVPERK